MTWRTVSSARGFRIESRIFIPIGAEGYFGILGDKTLNQWVTELLTNAVAALAVGNYASFTIGLG